MIYKIKITYIFSVIFAVLINLVSSANAGSNFAIAKGGEYKVCKDMYSYLTKVDEKFGREDIIKGSIFLIDDDRFFVPEFTVEHPYLGFKLLMQDLSLGSFPIKTWRSVISDLEKAMKEGTLEVKTGYIDLNNNGTKNYVATVSSFYENVGYFSIQIFAINTYKNLDVDFFEYGRYPTTDGQLFQYEGRTFSISRIGQVLSVNEFFKSPTRDKGGAHLRYEVCKIKL